MCRRLTVLVSLVLVLSLANSAPAAISFNWLGGTSNDWMDGSNWSTGTVPASTVSDEGSVTIQKGYDAEVVDPPQGWPVLSAAAPGIHEIRIGYEGVGGVYGQLNIIDGASVELTGDLRIGYNEGNPAYGELNMTGGTLSIGDDIRVGRYGTGVINMTGGLFISTDRAEALDLANQPGSFGIINLSGGLIDVHELGIGNGTVDIVISGTGVIKLDGDQQSVIQGLIDTGVIHGPDGVGYYMDSGYTYVVPEPATIALLALGGIALFRRRR